MNRGNFAQLLTPVHRDVFFLAYNELPPEYTQVCDVGNMRQAEETFQHMGAFGLWGENSEGNTINEDEMSEGEAATFTATRFDKGYEVTWELVKDDLYNVMAGMGKNGRSAEALGAGLHATVETELAAILNGGFTNTGYDAVSLFSASHPLADSTSLGDNLITGPLTDTNYKTMTMAMKDTRDEANIKVAARIKQLIVPDELEFVGKGILQSVNIAGELSNTKNTAPNAQLIVMTYLTSATAWFGRDPRFKNLTHLWREKPFFDSQPISKTIDQFMFGYTRFDDGYKDYRGLTGSLGT